MIIAEARTSEAQTFEARGLGLPTRGDGTIAPLPGTQIEADALRTSFPNATVYTGTQAQEDRAKREAGDCRYLHFATHGLFNAEAPLLSNVVLAQPPTGSHKDGFLTAREIFDLDLKADLVLTMLPHRAA